jgi:hypothetical protein
MEVSNMTDRTIKILSNLSIATGAWLLIFPFFITSTTIGFWHNIVIGLFVIALATIRELGDEMKTNWASWTIVTFGIWLIAATFLLNFNTAESINSVVIGFILVSLAGWNVSDTDEIDMNWRTIAHHHR